MTGWLKWWLIIVSLILGLLIIIPKNHIPQTAEKVAQLSTRQIVSLAPTIKTTKPSATKKDLFGTVDTLAWIERRLVEVENYIDPTARAEALLESRLDTRSNVVSALHVLSEPYSSEPEITMAKKKVLALHLVAISSHLSIKDCEATLSHLIELRAASNQEQVQRAIMWDIYGMAKVCSRMDREFMIRYEERVSDPAIAAQIKLALDASENT